MDMGQEDRKPTPFDALGFYQDLVARNSDLLGFSCSADRWQVIKGWLLSENLIID